MRVYRRLVDPIWIRQEEDDRTNRIHAENQARARQAGVIITIAEQAAWDAELDAARRDQAEDDAARTP